MRDPVYVCYTKHGNIIGNHVSRSYIHLLILKEHVDKLKKYIFERGYVFGESNGDHWNLECMNDDTIVKVGFTDGVVRDFFRTDVVIDDDGEIIKDLDWLCFDSYENIHNDRISCIIASPYWGIGIDLMKIVRRWVMTHKKCSVTQ